MHFGLKNKDIAQNIMVAIKFHYIFKESSKNLIYMTKFKIIKLINKL